MQCGAKQFLGTGAVQLYGMALIRQFQDVTVEERKRTADSQRAARLPVHGNKSVRGSALKRQRAPRVPVLSEFCSFPFPPSDIFIPHAEVKKVQGFSSSGVRVQQFPRKGQRITAAERGKA